MPDETAFVNEDTGLRNIEEMQMAEVEKVRKRIDMDIAREQSGKGPHHWAFL